MFLSGRGKAVGMVGMRVGYEDVPSFAQRPPACRVED